MEEAGGKVRALIERATNSTEREMDPCLLTAIKSVVRFSDSELRLAAQTLMDLMKRDHSQAIEFLEKWNSSFGVHYRQIRLGFDYLKTALRFQFPNLHANAARIQQERWERETKTKEILRNKFEVLKQNFSSIKEEIQSTMDEIGECLDIFRAKEENVHLDPIDDESFEEFHSSELRQIRLDSLKEGEKVHENNDNKVVFDALRQLCNLLEIKHLASVQEWVSVLVRVELPDNRFRDLILKEFIDIRNCLLAVKKKYEESGCALVNNVKHCKEDELEEDFWEEGKIGSSDNRGSSAPSKHNNNVIMASTFSKVRDKAPKGSNEKSDSNQSLHHASGKIDSTPLCCKLLAETPVIDWGFSDDSGAKKDVQINQRGMEFDNHWARVDYNAVILAEKIAELNLWGSPLQGRAGRNSTMQCSFEERGPLSEEVLGSLPISWTHHSPRQ